MDLAYFQTSYPDLQIVVLDEAAKSGQYEVYSPELDTWIHHPDEIIPDDLHDPTMIVEKIDGLIRSCGIRELQVALLVNRRGTGCLLVRAPRILLSASSGLDFDLDDETGVTHEEAEFDPFSPEDDLRKLLR